MIIFCVAGLSIGSSVNAFSISTDKKCFFLMKLDNDAAIAKNPIRITFLSDEYIPNDIINNIRN